MSEQIENIDVQFLTITDYNQLKETMIESVNFFSKKML